MMRLRQVAWVAADLAAAEQQVEDTLGLSRCYRDPGVATFGLHNALYPVGDQFLEIVSPLPGHTDTAGGRHLERRGGDAGYMVILQTDDLEAVRTRAGELGTRIIFEAPGGDGPTAIHGIHFHPRDVGGAILSIDRSATPAEWAWAGPEWRNHVQTDVVEAITSVTIEVPDPPAAANTWATLCGTTPTADHRLELDDATVRFVSGDRGVVGLGFAGTPAATDLLGTTIGAAT